MPGQEQRGRRRGVVAGGADALRGALGRAAARVLAAHAEAPLRLLLVSGEAELLEP